MDRPCALYRHFDQDGVLLYVGISVDPEERWKAHRYSRAEWAADSVRRVDDWFSSLVEAQAAERVAIKTERPKHNRQHNGRCRRPAPPPVEQVEWHWVENPRPEGGVLVNNGTARIVGRTGFHLVPEPYPPSRGYWVRRKCKADYVG